jgi:hypothetical protein
MRTLDLKEAADFLKLHYEEVRRRAKAGIVPCVKLGKRWGFIDVSSGCKLIQCSD